MKEIQSRGASPQRFTGEHSHKLTMGIEVLLPMNYNPVTGHAQQRYRMVRAARRAASLPFKSGVADVTSKMKLWMEEKEYESVDQMRGSMSYMNVDDPAKFERANYMKALHSYK